VDQTESNYWAPVTSRYISSPWAEYSYLLGFTSFGGFSIRLLFPSRQGWSHIQSLAGLSRNNRPEHLEYAEVRGIAGLPIFKSIMQQSRELCRHGVGKDLSLQSIPHTVTSVSPLLKASFASVVFFFYIDSRVVSLVGIRVPGSWERQATGIMLDDGRRRAIAYLSAH
jgi:hypothetical protein